MLTVLCKKSLVALLLVFSLFLCLLVSACTQKGEEGFSGDGTSTEETSASDTSSGSGTSGDEEAEQFTYRTNIALRKPYTGPEAEHAYPDTYGSELTDGLTYGGNGQTYFDPCWSDYGKPDPVEFIIDLEEVYSGIYAFGISYLVEIGPGIGAPQSVRVYWSMDGETWDGHTRIHTETTPEDGCYLGTADMEKSVSARYIRFSMSHYAANLFLDELYVYADVPPQDDTSVVRELVLQAYNEDTYSYSAAMASLASGVPDLTAAKQVFSTGATYGYSRGASEKFPDRARLLTDGRPTGASYESGAYAGYEGGDAVELTVNLPAGTDGVSVFEAYLYCNTALGAVPPVYMDVAVKNEKDGQFLTVGRVYAPSKSKDGPCTYTLSLPVTVSTKQVRFTFPAQDRLYLLIEELTVGGYREQDAPTFVGFYSETPIEKVTKDVYFPSSVKGYNERTNLISRLTQRIFSFVPLAEKTPGNSPENSALLTDGAYATNPAYTDGAYFKFGGGEGRDVVYDFGGLAAVDGFSVSFLRQDEVGINDIAFVMFYLSENGVDWYGVQAAALPSAKPTEFLRFDYTLDRVYRARFARFSFRVWPNAYCDELQVWGKKNASGASPLSESGREPTLMDQNAYAKRDVTLGGANDTVLIPNYSASDEKKNDPDAGFSVEELLAYVAYLDRAGNIKDTMFDGFLFCPTGAALNGGLFHDNASMAEMQDMYDKTFAAGRDVDALEQAAVKTAAALGRSDLKVYYYLPLYNPGEGISFGDLDGDGKADTLDSFEKRMDALRWQMDYILSLVKSRSDKHAVFAGFYWLHEGMNNVPDESLMLQTTSDETKKRGYGLFWIPFYKAPGFETWAFEGFDIACMQPNIAFSADSNDAYVEYCARIAKRLGMCVEMEISEGALADYVFFEKYMKYLRGGVTYGYMTETPHFYYQGVDIFLLASRSESDRTRLIYDGTYAFIKGELPKPEPLKDTSFAGQKGTLLTDTLNATGTDGELYFLVLSPEHGTVTVDEDGSFVYYPEAGFTGTDHFYVIKNNYLYETEIAEIMVRIAS